MNSAKKKRLGRGLEALLSVSTPAPETPSRSADSLHDILNAAPSDPLMQRASNPVTAPIAPPIATAESTLIAPSGSMVEPDAGIEHDAALSDMQRLDVFQIDDNPFQPRRVFSEPEIASLSESLKDHDLLQPILVRKIGDRFQLISGERRLRAAIQAGWTTIPARIRQADDRLVAELAIVENLQRKDLNPLEKALSFKRYLTEHQATQDELAQRLKIDRSTIANLMRLLELPQLVQDQVSNGTITAGHARALLPLGEETEQIAFANRIVKESWNVRETERRVSEHIADQDGVVAKSKRKPGNPQLEHLEQQARMALGTRVEIKATSKGSGKMVLHFKNEKEFERLFAQVCQQQDLLNKVA